MTMNKVVNHIALHVPDIDAAVEWYTSLFGFRKLKDMPHCSVRSENPDAPVFRVYDGRLQSFKVAFLTAGNGVGFELFQFIDPPMSEQSSFNYTRGGVFHVAITDHNPEGQRKYYQSGREEDRRNSNSRFHQYQGRGKGVHFICSRSMG
jgi:catechol 2,3-dioxygenase-like lactoylglutathione lyase family enzyme